MSKSGVEKHHTVGSTGTSGLIQIPNAMSPSGEPQLSPRFALNGQQPITLQAALQAAAKERSPVKNSPPHGNFGPFSNHSSSKKIPYRPRISQSGVLASNRSEAVKGLKS
jgi:hypothetical protein